MNEGQEALNNALGEFDNPTPPQVKEEPAAEEKPVTPVEEPSTEEKPKEEEPSKEEEPPKEEAEESPEDLFKNSKQNKAFADMRVQNKRLSKIVSDLGRVMDVPEGTEPDKLIELAEAKLTELKAQADKVPVELYKELEDTRQKQAQAEQENLRQQATLSFQKVKDHYGLTQRQLMDFAQQLNDAEKNPFTTPMDLVQEYRNLNWDSLLERERTKAEKEYQERLKKAESKSTAPSKNTGGEAPGTPEKISSMKDFNDLLEGMK